MKMHGTAHVYKIIPDLFGNKEADKPAIFHLKGISQEDFSEAVRSESLITQNHTREEASKKIGESAAKLIADRVVKIENLVIDGKEITDYDGLSKHAPRELCNYIVACVHSTEIMSAEEIKN